MLGTLCTLMAVLARGIAVPFATPSRFLLTREDSLGTRGMAALTGTSPPDALIRGTLFTEARGITALTGGASPRAPVLLRGSTALTTAGPDLVTLSLTTPIEGLLTRGNATPGPETDQLRAPRPSPISTTPSARDDNELEEDGDEEGPDLIRTIKDQVRLLLACVPRWGAVSCLKLEALLLLQGDEADLAQDPKERDAHLNKMLIGALQDILEETLYEGDEKRSRGRRRRKGKGWAGPLLAVMFGLGALIIVVGIGKTAMVAGKALAVSTLALVIALFVGLRGGGGPRGGGGGGGFGNYEILATGIRRRVGSAGGGPSGPSGSGLQPFAHIYLDAEADQTQAYSSHHTRP